MLGVSVYRGRERGRSCAARVGSSQNCSPRTLMPMPVLPRMTAPPIQPPLGVASKMLPSLSMTEMCVVSLSEPRMGSASGAGPPDFVPSEILAAQYFHSFTFGSDAIGLPAMKPREECFGSMSAARCFAYAFDNRPSPAIL